MRYILRTSVIRKKDSRNSATWRKYHNNGRAINLWKKKGGENARKEENAGSSKRNVCFLHFTRSEVKAHFERALVRAKGQKIIPTEVSTPAGDTKCWMPFPAETFPAQSVQAEAWQQLGRARQTGGQMTKRIPNTKLEYELPSSPKISSACSPLFQPVNLFRFSSPSVQVFDKWSCRLSRCDASIVLRMHVRVKEYSLILIPLRQRKGLFLRWKELIVV